MTSQLHDKIKAAIQSKGPVSVDNITGIVLQGMVEVEKIPGLDGVHKKQLVISTINMILDEDVTLGTNEKQLIKTLVPSAVDVLCYVGNKGYRKFQKACCC